jgi:hypothetical protein
MELERWLKVYRQTLLKNFKEFEDLVFNHPELNPYSIATLEEHFKCIILDNQIPLRPIDVKILNKRQDAKDIIKVLARFLREEEYFCLLQTLKLNSDFHLE